MSLIKIGGAWLLYFVTSSCWASIISDTLPRRAFAFGISSLGLEQPDGSREDRWRFDLNHYERLTQYLRLSNRFSRAFDQRPRSQLIKIAQNQYELFSGISYARSYLFRYSVGFGPLLLWEDSKLEIETTKLHKQTLRRWQLACASYLSVDYAFSQELELNFAYSLQWRKAVDKTDQALSLSLSWNAEL